ncbi:MAG: hypothetical protein ACR2ND_14855 [Solirubrobacteraceae bacterium]
MKLIATLASAALLLLMPAPAVLADGDPASDVLLNGDVFYPYQPLVSLPLTTALNKAVKDAHGAGFPIKVALIASANDLGAVPDLFAKPQKYSDFLDREISYNQKAALLVVMPQGIGTTGAGSPAPLASIKIGALGSSSDSLARAGIQAVSALAAQAGHSIPATKIPTASQGSGHGGGGTSPLLTFGAPLLLVLAAALGARFIRARQERDEEA